LGVPKGVRPMPLTELGCKNARPRDKQYKLADGGGLYLLVHPNGGRYWRHKYRWQGKEKLLSYGVYPEIPLASARDRREETRRTLRAGIDPSASRKQERLVAAVKSANTFEIVGREWFGKKDWKDSHADRVMRSLEADVFPHLGERPVADITAPEILAVVRIVEKREALDIAGRVLQRIGAIIRYAIVTGRAQRNPALDLRGALKPPAVTNRRALPAEDLPAFLRALSAYRGHAQVRLAMRFHILTFVRPGELRTAEWSEIDDDAALWRIPAAKMKMGEEHLVPLSSQALEVLDELRAISGKRRFVFPNLSTPSKVMSENTLLRCIELLGYRDVATAHGFRTTASTWLNEAGWPSDWIERQLAHTPKDKIRGVYNKAQWLPQRRQMMQAWADALAAMEAGGRVVRGRFESSKAA
jgi:integrase